MKPLWLMYLLLSGRRGGLCCSQADALPTAAWANYMCQREAGSARRRHLLQTATAESSQSRAIRIWSFPPYTAYKRTSWQWGNSKIQAFSCICSQYSAGAFHLDIRGKARRKFELIANSITVPCTKTIHLHCTDTPLKFHNFYMISMQSKSFCNV